MVQWRRTIRSLDISSMIADEYNEGGKEMVGLIYRSQFRVLMY